MSTWAIIRKRVATILLAEPIEIVVGRAVTPTPTELLMARTMLQHARFDQPVTRVEIRGIQCRDSKIFDTECRVEFFANYDMVELTLCARFTPKFDPLTLRWRAVGMGFWGYTPVMIHGLQR
jgi:hypothetical protein